MNFLKKTNPIRPLTVVLIILAITFPMFPQENVADGTPFIPQAANEISQTTFFDLTPVVNELTAVAEPDNSSEIISETTVNMKNNEPVTESIATEMGKLKTVSRLAVKTNLLYYAILMPNIEAEWKFKDRWSATLEVQGAWYAKNDPHKVYRIATVIPEVRFWAIERSRWNGIYVGAFVGGGLYDLCDSKKGHEGEGALAGISAGYMWAIGKHLSLDAGIGIGYLYARDKLYYPRDGHYLYQLTKNINYFGPLRLRLSLVWRFQTEK